MQHVLYQQARTAALPSVMPLSVCIGILLEILRLRPECNCLHAVFTQTFADDATR